MTSLRRCIGIALVLVVVVWTLISQIFNQSVRKGPVPNISHSNDGGRQYPLKGQKPFRRRKLRKEFSQFSNKKGGPASDIFTKPRQGTELAGPGTAEKGQTGQAQLIRNYQQDDDGTTIFGGIQPVNQGDNYIVGGTNANAGEFPFYVRFVGNVLW